MHFPLLIFVSPQLIFIFPRNSKNFHLKLILFLASFVVYVSAIFVSIHFDLIFFSYRKNIVIKLGKF